MSSEIWQRKSETAYVFMYEHSAISCTGFRRRIEAKPYANRVEIIRKSCSYRAVTESHRARATSVRRPRGDGTVTARFPYDFRSSCSFLAYVYKMYTNSHFCLCCQLRWHLKQKAGMERGPRKKKKNVDPSQGGRTMGLPQDN